MSGGRNNPKKPTKKNPGKKKPIKKPTRPGKRMNA
jgi:hypothetical protein